MKTLTKSILVVFFFLWTMVCGLSTISYADIPHLINYQGKLADTTGKPVTDGAYSVTFRIYDAESAGTLLWEETQSVSISKGIFSIMLGGVVNLNLAFDKSYWLEIKVGTEVMSPRQRIASVRYALRSEIATEAQNSDTVDGIHASTTPEANKLIALDNNAKLPTTALRVYDSGWFSVKQDSSYRLLHRLGTTKLAIFVYGATSSNGANMTLAQDSYYNVSVEEGMEVGNITPTEFTLVTGWGQSRGQGGYHSPGDGRGDAIPFTYARIIAMSLGD